jgi:hypothetical protein
MQFSKVTLAQYSIDITEGVGAGKARTTVLDSTRFDLSLAEGMLIAAERDSPYRTWAWPVTAIREAVVDAG